MGLDWSETRTSVASPSAGECGQRQKIHWSDIGVLPRAHLRHELISRTSNLTCALINPLDLTLVGTVPELGESAILGELNRFFCVICFKQNHLFTMYLARGSYNAVNLLGTPRQQDKASEGADLKGGARKGRKNRIALDSGYVNLRGSKS